MNDLRITLDADARTLVFETRDGAIGRMTINFPVLLAAMTEEEQVHLADVLVGEESVLAAALRRLSGADATGHWWGHDAIAREELLAKLGALHTQDVARFEKRSDDAWALAYAVRGQARDLADQFRDHFREGSRTQACCSRALHAFRQAQTEPLSVLGERPPPVALPAHERPPGVHTAGTLVALDFCGADDPTAVAALGAMVDKAIAAALERAAKDVETEMGGHTFAQIAAHLRGLAAKPAATAPAPEATL